MPVGFLRPELSLTCASWWSEPSQPIMASVLLTVVSHACFIYLRLLDRNPLCLFHQAFSFHFSPGFFFLNLPSRHHLCIVERECSQLWKMSMSVILCVSGVSGRGTWIVQRESLPSCFDMKPCHQIPLYGIPGTVLGWGLQPGLPRTHRLSFVPRSIIFKTTGLQFILVSRLISEDYYQELETGFRCQWADYYWYIFMA